MFMNKHIIGLRTTVVFPRGFPGDTIVVCCLAFVLDVECVFSIRASHVKTRNEKNTSGNKACLLTIWMCTTKGENVNACILICYNENYIVWPKVCGHLTITLISTF